MRYVVYRFRDAEGQLLYIGASANIGQRIGTHSQQSGWWPEVASIEFEDCADEATMTARELVAIAAERPLHNLRMQPYSPHTRGVSAEGRAAIGQRLTELRDAAGLTQDELARMLNVSQPAICQWERGVKVPRRTRQYRIADTYGVRRDWLFAEAVKEAA